MNLRCELFRADPGELVEALSAEIVLRRYLETLTAELPTLADRTLTAHLRRLGKVAAMALGSGMTVLARRDAAAADELLTDLLAVATWHRWELPLERLGEAEVAVDGLPRGLLGADPGREGASVWVLDPGKVALARNRASAEAVDWPAHQPDGGCTH